MPFWGSRCAVGQPRKHWKALKKTGYLSTDGALAVTGRLVLTVAGRLLSESADGVAARQTTETACSSLMLSTWCVLFSEVRWGQRVDLTGFRLSSLITASSGYLFPFKFKLFCYRRSVDQPTGGPITRLLLLSDIYCLHVMGHPPWREDGSVPQNSTIIFYCLIWDVRYYFLSECCCLKFAVLYLWGALSD
jgi:hypothetical protein